jgi:hypothetical protein
MTTIERVEQELKKAEERLAEAKTALDDFDNAKYKGKRLKELFEKEESTLSDREANRLGTLEEEQKALKKAVEEGTKAVNACVKKLLEFPAQPGNDFVTRRWGRGVGMQVSWGVLYPRLRSRV